MVAHVTKAVAGTLVSTTGRGADGVVRVRVGEEIIGSGALLYDGRHILTARHLIDGLPSTTSLTVTFETTAGTRTINVSDAWGLASWDSDALGDDLLLLTLSESAPVEADRYSLYRDSDEINQAFVMVGYGISGDGNSGTTTEDGGSTLRRFAENRFDGEMAALKLVAGGRLGWNPPSDTQLWADFDNGLAAQDASRLWTGFAELGRGDREGMITPGDSGGPAFVNGQLTGIASYTFRGNSPSGTSDIDAVGNSSFGEVGVWQRVSRYQDWIDPLLRTSYPDAPTQPSQVKKAVTEGNAGTSYAYFLLQFTGTRSDADEILSVDYATRDGSAQAGSDYLAVSGQLNLYPDEKQAVIAVELIGDTLPEPDETFYLDVTNPVGGSFGNGAVKLVAIRTIVNDDGGFSV